MSWLWVLTLYAATIVNTKNFEQSLAELSAEHESMVAMFYVNRMCAGREPIKVMSEAQHPVPTYLLNGTKGLLLSQFNERMPGCKSGLCNLPSFVYVRGGQIEDVMNDWFVNPQTNALVWAAFHERNAKDLYPPESQPQALQEQRVIWRFEDPSLVNVFSGNGVYINGRLERRRFRYANFANSDLRGTSFNGSIFERAVFARANLQGASFKGAALRNVLWGACICPDGTKSRDHGYTCEGHLKPYKFKVAPQNHLTAVRLEEPLPVIEGIEDVGKDWEARLKGQ